LVFKLWIIISHLDRGLRGLEMDEGMIWLWVLAFRLYEMLTDY